MSAVVWSSTSRETAGRARSRSSAARSRAASEASTPTGPRGSRPRPAPASRAPRTLAPSPRDGPVDHPRKAQAGDLVERRVGSRAGRDASCELVDQDTGNSAKEVLQDDPFGTLGAASCSRVELGDDDGGYEDVLRVGGDEGRCLVMPAQKSIKTSVSTRIGRDMVQSRAHPRRSASGSGRSGRSRQIPAAARSTASRRLRLACSMKRSTASRMTSLCRLPRWSAMAASSARWCSVR